MASTETLIRTAITNTNIAVNNNINNNRRKKKGGKKQSFNTTPTTTTKKNNGETQAAPAYKITVMIPEKKQDDVLKEMFNDYTMENEVVKVVEELMEHLIKKVPIIEKEYVQINAIAWESVRTVKIQDILKGTLTPPANFKDVVIEREIGGVAAKVLTSERFVNNLATICAMKSQISPQHELLAGRISMWWIHRVTPDTFSAAFQLLRDYPDRPLIRPELNDIVQQNASYLNKLINHDQDYTYGYFSVQTMKTGYLKRYGSGKEVPLVERYQYSLMRVAIELNRENMKGVKETYEALSKKLYTHATPTLFNAGSSQSQLASCFLFMIKDDSIDGIYDTLKSTALCAKFSGGVGVGVNKIRALGAPIRGTDGTSNGLNPMLQVFNWSSRYVDQGGGKRKGNQAIYIAPWHLDIRRFLALKDLHKPDDEQAKDLLLALWNPDLFFQRVYHDQPWTLFCPQEAKGLNEVHGKAFTELYEKYERDPRIKRKQVISTRDLFKEIARSCIITGGPYMMAADSANCFNNQQNLGTIQSSNLCTEIIQFTSPEEVAVCNLGSISVKEFYDPESGSYDFSWLVNIARLATRNCDQVIDYTYYPIEEARRSNLRHRPINIGIQGFADLLMMMKIPYESEKALQLSQNIMESIYYGFTWESSDLARVHGHYESYQGSPVSKGLLQFDLWLQEQRRRHTSVVPAGTPGMYEALPFPLIHNWAPIREQVRRYGLRNSMGTGCQPTASTAQLMGNFESFEPPTSNDFVRRTNAGDFIVINKYLVANLRKLGLWTDTIRGMITRDYGSVQNIPEIPEDIKVLYKTIWEVSGVSQVDHCAARQPFCTQSQSFNVHMRRPTINKLMSLWYDGWRKGLVTQSYYTRVDVPVKAQQPTLRSSGVLSQTTTNTLTKSTGSSNPTAAGVDIAPTFTPTPYCDDLSCCT